MEVMPNIEAEHVHKDIGENKIGELSIASIDAFLDRSKKVQENLSSIDISERMDVFEMMGEAWVANLAKGEYSDLARDLAGSTGYTENLMGIELGFVREMFSKENIERNLRYSFIKSIGGLNDFIVTEDGESYRYLPSGPVFIISSGNSLIPPLIPTTLSLVTGNCTILKPSLSNYKGVYEAYSLMKGIGTKASDAMSDALAISYFTHDSGGLEHLLKKCRLGVVNFWGADPARTNIGVKVASNPHHPKYLINGPLTGMAIIDRHNASEESARAMALNMVLYDQQLCSSPTQALFIGDKKEADEFALKVSTYLDALGSSMPMDLNEGQIFALQNARRAMMFKGSKVISSKDNTNPWTLAVSKGDSVLDPIVLSQPELNIFNRRRFLEIVVIEDDEKVPVMIESIPHRMAFMGVDKVQTVGLAVNDETYKRLLGAIPATGVYRITPLKDMFMRSALEPYDGVNIASIFTYTLYSRSKSMETDVIE